MPTNKLGKCKCGGKLAIEDFRLRATRQFRYQVYCRKCRSCDPNGYSSLKKALAGAAEYFKTGAAR